MPVYSPKDLKIKYCPQLNVFPMLANKPDNVILQIQVFFQHFSHELIHFFGPTDVFWGGFSGYKAKAMFFFNVSLK